ncbi:MAG: hypothetical protein AAFR97_14860, partial [Bacteroidota bacterium]
MFLSVNLFAQNSSESWIAIEATPPTGRYDDVHISALNEEETAFEAWAVNSLGMVFHAPDLDEIEDWHFQFRDSFNYFRAIDFLEDGLTG